MAEKFLTVLVVPHDERNVRRMRVSYRRIRALAAGALLAAVVGVVGALSYGRLATRATQAAMLERENARLSAENAMVDSIAANLERTERAYDQIRQLAGIPPEAAAAGAAPAAEPAAAWDPAPLDVQPAAAARLGWPLGIKGFVSARFTGPDGHPGIDIAAPSDTPVVATAAGAVQQSGFDRVLGHFVVLQHDDELETMYAHNALLLVERGDRVERGETIGYSGDSGRAAAPHLHYEVRRDGMPIDPSPYLP